MNPNINTNTLTNSQNEAVEIIDGPLLIIAGAGAGKTKVLTHRIANLIHHGTVPENILAITFTNKAAKEMRERVHKLLEEERIQGSPWIGTFHALGATIARENAHLLGRTKTFSILDEGDTNSIIKDAIIYKNLDPKQLEPKKVKGIISRAKMDGYTPTEFMDRARSYVEEQVAGIWQIYEDNLKKENGFDFDDLLSEPVKLLTKNEEVRNKYKNKWKFIHIDEYQDTNELQYKMGKLLTSDEQNICVVGDSDQNIYSWRGANLRNILNFEKDFPGARTVVLEENFRSTQTILKVANDIIAKNTVRKDKVLFTKNGEGELIGMYSAYNETDEALFVANKINELLRSGVREDEIAVLYRANFQSRVLEEACLSENISYQVLGTKFFERREVKDTIAYIRAARNKESLSDIKRIINFPPRGIGKVTLVKMFSGLQSDLPKAMQIKILNFYNLLEKIKILFEENLPSIAIHEMLKITGIEEMLKNGTEEDVERYENLRELVNLATRYDKFDMGEGIDKLLDDASLQSDQDNLDEAGKAGVRLMTVHASKGLEFSYVFIVGLEQDLFPHAKSKMAKLKEDEEEERRLMYVAVTRAKKKLFLSYAEMRTLFGERNMTIPSEFLYDIDDAMTEHIARPKRGSNNYQSDPDQVFYLD